MTGLDGQSNTLKKSKGECNPVKSSIMASLVCSCLLKNLKNRSKTVQPLFPLSDSSSREKEPRKQVIGRSARRKIEPVLLVVHMEYLLCRAVVLGSWVLCLDNLLFQFHVRGHVQPELSVLSFK